MYRTTAEHDEVKCLVSLPDSITRAIVSTVSRSAIKHAERFYGVVYAYAGILRVRAGEDVARTHEDLMRDGNLYAAGLLVVAFVSDAKLKLALARRLAVAQLYAVRASGTAERAPFRLFLCDFNMGYVDFMYDHMKLQRLSALLNHRL